MFSFIGVISLTTGKMVPLLVKRNGNDKEIAYNLHIFEPCKNSHDNFLAAKTVTGYYNIKQILQIMGGICYFC